MTTPRIHQAHVVHTREKWADEWTEQPYLYCDSFSLVAGPDVAEATLSFDYGVITPSDSLNSSTRAKRELSGHYVRVMLDQFTEDDEETVVYWYGLVIDTTEDREATVNLNDTAVESGHQTFHCRGLEFLLQRKIVKTSWVTDTDGGEIEIGRAIAFNAGAGRSSDHQRLGNKSETPGERDAPIFAFEIAVGGLKTEVAETLWSVQDIVVYLLHYHPPADIDGTDKLNWTSPDGGDAEILEKIFPVQHSHGKSIKQHLDELIDRRRLVGYNIIVQGEDDAPKVNVFTFNKDTIDLPGGSTVPANGNQQTWYFDDDGTIETAVVNSDDATRYDRVIVQGAPLGACFTVAHLSGGTPFDGLIKDWDDTSATAYDDGASADGGYSALISMDKQAANQAFRADDIFAKVYRAVMLDPGLFDGYANGETVCPDPTLEIDGEPGASPSPFWYPGLRFLDRLPLRTDYDYSTVEDFEATTLTIDSSQPNYIRPFAVGKIGSLYYRLDQPGQGKSTAETLRDGGRNWAASLRMQDDCPGLFIDVHGAPQHVIAEDEFTPADDDDEADADAQMDWKDIACTIFCEFDQHVEARIPSEELTTEADQVRELLIERPEYRLDYLTPGTVIGVDDAGALITTDGGYVRDDRAKMQDIAQCAFAWYGQTRKALTIVQNDLICDHQIGELITNIGSAESPVEVNSVITKMVYDIKAGTVTVTAQYAELDFSR